MVEEKAVSAEQPEKKERVHFGETNGVLIVVVSDKNDVMFTKAELARWDTWDRVRQVCLMLEPPLTAAEQERIMKVPGNENGKKEFASALATSLKPAPKVE
jgi:hypothetical protein